MILLSFCNLEHGVRMAVNGNWTKRTVGFGQPSHTLFVFGRINTKLHKKQGKLNRMYNLSLSLSLCGAHRVAH